MVHRPRQSHHMIAAAQQVPQDLSANQARSAAQKDGQAAA